MAEPTLIERLREGTRYIHKTAAGKLMLEAADALERHSLPGGAAGYRLVPEEPTEAMIAAGRKAFQTAKGCEGYSYAGMMDAYRTMLAASPPPPSVWDGH